MRMQGRLDRIEQLWEEHEGADFPLGVSGGEIGDVDLVLLDAANAGCVSTFVERGGELDVQRAAILGRCYRNATVVLPFLPEPARAHFSRLELVAREVLEALSIDEAEA